MRGLKRTVCTLVVLALFTLPVTAVSAGAWRGNGTPLTEVASGKFRGDVFIGGGHGYTKENPYTESYDLPDGLVRFARLYIPVWDYNPGVEVEPVLNGQSLGKIQGMPNYLAGFGVSLYALDVTHQVIMNATNSLEVRYVNPSGGPYGAYLVVAYENPDLNVVQFWLAEGNQALSPQSRNQSETVFDAFSRGNDTDRLVNPSLVQKGTLHTLVIGGTEDGHDRLSFNGQLLGVDVDRGKGGPYTDFDSFDVTGLLEPQHNIVLLERGDKKYLHPMIGLLVINYTPEAAAEVDDFLSIDQSITQRSLTQAQTSWLNRYLGQIPMSVIIVLVLVIFMVGISWFKLRRRETL